MLPAEAIAGLAPVAPRDLLLAHMRLFDALPSMFVFDRLLFVHAGIPRDDTIAQKLKTLAALNDPQVRLQMAWSDPSDADFVPLELQRASARFPFGRMQFRTFMARVGCSVMIRGHERVVEGLRQVYADPDALLLSLFSSGGASNVDLPEDSNYREVVPMALTIRHKDGASRITPFPIAYERYCHPAYNGLLPRTMTVSAPLRRCVVFWVAIALSGCGATTVRVAAAPDVTTSGKVGFDATLGARHRPAARLQRTLAPLRPGRRAPSAAGSTRRRRRGPWCRRLTSTTSTGPSLARTCAPARTSRCAACRAPGAVPRARLRPARRRAPHRLPRRRELARHARLRRARAAGRGAVGRRGQRGGGLLAAAGGGGQLAGGGGLRRHG